jgi:hypothetical protein
MFEIFYAICHLADGRHLGDISDKKYRKNIQSRFTPYFSNVSQICADVISENASGIAFHLLWEC